jgi:hypothetical protein
MFYFCPYSQYSNIPFFHSDGINRLLLINLYFQKVVKYPRRLITIPLWIVLKLREFCIWR